MNFFKDYLFIIILYLGFLYVFVKSPDPKVFERFPSIDELEQN